MEAIPILYWASPLKLLFFVQHRGLEGSTLVVSRCSFCTTFVVFVVQNRAPVWSILTIFEEKRAPVRSILNFEENASRAAPVPSLLEILNKIARRARRPENFTENRAPVPGILTLFFDCSFKLALPGGTSLKFNLDILTYIHTYMHTYVHTSYIHPQNKRFGASYMRALTYLH